MTSSATRFPVTILSTDTTALREISWTLSSFGYEVVASSDWSDLAAWRRNATASLLLIDARDGKECREVLCSPRTTHFIYRIAFYGTESSTNPDQLLDLGADDLVRFPVNIGELLSRLKSGARRLEFEERFNRASSLDPQTGIATRSGFVRQLERQLRTKNDAQDGALVVMGIDALSRLHMQKGYFAVREATTMLAQCLNEKLSDEDLCGIVQEGEFAVLLQGCTVSEGIELAQDISKQVNHKYSASHGENSSLSISGVVLNWPAGDTAEDAVTRGTTALSQVRGYGGNLILDANDVEQEFSTWKQKFPPYHEVYAQHVMEALPLVLPKDGLGSGENQSLGIYSFASNQTLPPCVPVVDEKGQLLGALESDSFRQSGSDVFHTIDEHLVPVSDTVKVDMRLDEIISSMAMAQKDYLVVVENEKPVGYITYDNLAALTVDPIDEQSGLDPAEAGLNSLVVALS
ncbi:diguanylate cyclase domain-containing protein [Bythopirellula goksoeyrii]|uniref:Response regulator PleD n=1 Tax=Bythopirellula goksoeyrii TaxID=1400387 RepID=A0A5B9Q5V9_9BACT|nr:diguanylate cyclase [Bythopirellula goksoeyrii]QEG34454.1 response regulator PleD [Bythopirellula goksoeyrii]